MTDPIRPVPRWLHVWAVATLFATLLLLGIGQVVTSHAAGMADPLWPTEPWYVFSTATPGEKERFRQDSAYFVEHSHRIAAFTVGGLVTVLALGLAASDPRRTLRWVAVGGALVLLVGFGEFHRELMAQNKLIASGTLSKADIKLPARGTPVALLGLAVALGVAASGLFRRGGAVRFLGTLALVAVMVQGLFGGVRVLMNELIGPDLAMIHGMFAQVVFGLLTAVAVLSARREPASDGEAGERPVFGWWPVALAVLVFVQVVFGAMVRHAAGPLTQRLHMFTAFVATVAVLWFVRAVRANPAARARAGSLSHLLGMLLVIQVYLGVEVWLARFGVVGLTEPERMTPLYIATRTLHALVGSGVWAASLAIALRLWRPAGRSHTLEVHTFGAAADSAPSAAAVGSLARGDAR